MDFGHDEDEEGVLLSSWLFSAVSTSSSGQAGLEGDARVGRDRLLSRASAVRNQQQRHHRRNQQHELQLQRPERQQPSLQIRLLRTNQQHRRTEDKDVNYWRQRAGWFNDDASMRQYNNGVYDTYYQMEDDGSGEGRSGRRHRSHSFLVKTILKVVCVVVALILCALMFRAIMRRIGSSKKDKKRSDSRSRSGRSKSRSRSRSRTRKGGSEYNLMEDDADAKSTRSKRSHRSSRSKSEKRSSSRSRSRNRSRSKSRTDGKDESVSPPTEPVLV